MSFDADEEILQDFLIEAGEILESLSEQLVALENEPEDMDLLNAIFRGFHTVKGGAGFLNLAPLVEICHITENIFDILRNGERTADADLMDVILQALDVINDMFASVQGGEMPENADKDLLSRLQTFASPAGAEAEAVAVEAEDSSDNQSEDISDAEFDALLDDLQGASAAPASDKPSAGEQTSHSSDDITDEEFEALLDELHGEGQFGDAEDKKPVVAEAKEPAVAEAKATTADSSDDITDEEFEALLDELHGKGGTVTADNLKQDKTASSAKSSAKAAAKPLPEASDDLINDDEFEALLDELHGAGLGPGSDKNASSSTPPQTPDSAKQSKGGSASKSSGSANDSNKAKAKITTPKKAPAPKPEPVAPQAATAKKTIVKKPAPVAEATVRVDTRRLDDIMNMVGELVLARNRLKTLGSATQNEELGKAVATLDLVTADLQGAVMKTRMQPIKKVFGRFPRVVRDLARSLKKEITLEMVGEETDLDKNLVEALADPLVHLVRNSVDHGIESPEDRVKAGKPRAGKIMLSAAQEGDHIMLSIEDDGKGMNADVLRDIAVDKGLMDKEQAARLTNEECYNLIFMAGFSTKKEISDISGRGVGMDVVKTKITQLNGSLTIESEMGKGTKILIKVPLTLAILPTLMVMVGKQAFALPLTAVNEIFHLDLTKTNLVDNQLMIVVREKALPLFYLNEWLTHNFSGERQREGHVVLVQVGTQRVGFVVDSLVGQEEVVIKPLGKSLQGTPGMAGATITSDGGIALIIDIPSLLKHYAGN